MGVVSDCGAGDPQIKVCRGQNKSTLTMMEHME